MLEFVVRFFVVLLLVLLGLFIVVCFVWLYLRCVVCADVHGFFVGALLCVGG